MCVSLLITYFFFFNDTATTEIYTLSLHDALPIFFGLAEIEMSLEHFSEAIEQYAKLDNRHILELTGISTYQRIGRRSEEHTSELQSRQYLVCRLLLEKKKKTF